MSDIGNRGNNEN